MLLETFSRIIRESVPALIAAALIQIVAGVTMELRGIEAWLEIPVLLMLVPSLSDLGNDVACIVSSRITTLLALGVIEPKLERNEALEASIISIVIVGVLSSLYMGAINFVVAQNAGFSSVPLFRLLLICVVSVTVLTVIVSGAAVGIAFIAWRRGLDPDNVTIPISTSVSDLIAIFSLLMTIRIV